MQYTIIIVKEVTERPHRLTAVFKMKVLLYLQNKISKIYLYTILIILYE
jgi:hypothetical protein